MTDVPAQQPPPDLKARIKTSYDAIAETYNKWTTQHSDVRVRYLSKLFDLLPADSPRPLRILELGCGAGEPSTKLLASRPNVQVVGNDISSAQVAMARVNAQTWELGEGSSVEFIEGDMADLTVLDFEKGSLDGVVALYSLIHLPREEQTVMLGRINRWLKPGGLLMGNFSEGEAEGIVMEEWLDEKGWMF
ncbi:hypothetical protein jhhlp_002692 [Lomentospora prolificans]|uniref:Methyltransferase domain-containing protein n=1 Tax=Lomentospora prolificans TaxID=41688 RepID=A0A2N3NES2_9PEZI|nr:hypothetical protein jhhlp_002692 [Lomentospora prolificans]